jgi:exosome complex component RRP41
VLQADGGNYCACVNAATLALIDAGIPLRDYVCACSATFVRDQAMVDMNHLEESSSGHELILATLPKTKQIVFLEMNSRLHEDHLSAVMDKAVEGCTDVFHVLDAAVREHVQETAASLGGDVARDGK